MKNKRVVFTILIQTVCWTVIGLIGLAYFEKPAQAAGAFLGPIFYGKEVVLKVFDHQYPLWESVYGNDGNFFTMHYDGLPRDDDNGRYGYDQHTGIDYDLSYEPVLAAASGDVEQAGWASPDNHKDSYGLHVRIDHKNGYHSLYGHLSSLAVIDGQPITVDPNDPGNRQSIIGISGNTGTTNDNSCPAVEDNPTCGDHLHFELRLGNRPVDPYGWIGTSDDPWAIYSPTTTPIYPTPLSTLTPPIPETPGTPVTRGALSEDVWLDYPANSDPNAQYPTGMPVIQPTPPTGYITVDNGDANYSENLPSCLQTGTGGYNDDFRFMTITEFGAPPTPTPTATCLARWTILPPSGTPPEDGYYEVYIHIPDTEAHTFTRGAVYSIWHHPTINDPLAEHKAVVAQAAYQDDETDSYFPDPWVYIGLYHFTLDGTEFIEVGNVTLDDDGTGFGVAVDAVKLAPLFDVAPTSTSTSTPTLTNTPAPPDTPTPDSTPIPGNGNYMTRLTAGTYGVNSGYSAISDDGRYVAYSYDGAISRYGAGSTEVVANADSSSIDITANGRYIAYDALGPNFQDVFLYDNDTHSSQNLTNHAQNSSVFSIFLDDIQIKVVGDSVLVAYTTATIDLAYAYHYQTWLYDSVQGTPTEINLSIGSTRPMLKDISDDGTLLFQGSNSLYVVNRSGQILETINPPASVHSVSVTGAGFSADGNFVVYQAYQQVCSATCWYNVHVLLYDRATENSEEISMFADGGKTYVPLRVSDNGRYVFYYANADNIFRYDRWEEEHQRVTLLIDDNQSSGPFYNMDISGDGRFVTFTTSAGYLVSGDNTYGTGDVFLADMDLWTGTPAPTPTPFIVPPTATPGICFLQRVTSLVRNDSSSAVAAHPQSSEGIAEKATSDLTEEQVINPVRRFVSKMLQTGDMLTLLYRLRDEVMSQTETGLFYTDLYYAHTDELSSLVESDPDLFQEAHDAVLLFQPHLEDFLNGDGNSVIVTAAEVQAVQSLLDQFAALGSPALQQTIADEQARWPLAQFIGKTSSEV